MYIIKNLVFAVYISIFLIFFDFQFALYHDDVTERISALLALWEGNTLTDGFPW